MLRQSPDLTCWKGRKLKHVAAETHFRGAFCCVSRTLSFVDEKLKYQFCKCYLFISCWWFLIKCCLYVFRDFFSAINMPISGAFYKLLCTFLTWAPVKFQPWILEMPTANRTFWVVQINKTAAKNGLISAIVSGHWHGEVALCRAKALFF